MLRLAMPVQDLWKIIMAAGYHICPAARNKGIENGDLIMMMLQQLFN